MIIYIGDTHGDLNFIYGVIHKYPACNIIQLGDFGIGFKGMMESEQYALLETTLRNTYTNLYIIRGNHDNPKYFNGDFMEGPIKLVPDYTVLELEGKRIFCLGGGISIDRSYRTLNVSYWKDEKILYDKERLQKIEKIDYVASHSAPDFCKPKGVNSDIVNQWCFWDKTLRQELIEERHLIAKIFYSLNERNKIRGWFYGHFHLTDTTIKDKVLFKALGINQIYTLDVTADKKTSK